MSVEVLIINDDDDGEEWDQGKKEILTFVPHEAIFIALDSTDEAVSVAYKSSHIKHW